MENLNSYVDTFTPTQHVIVGTCFTLFVSVLTKYWMVCFGFVAFTILAHVIIDHFKAAESLYDSTFLITVVDTISYVIDQIKAEGNPIEPVPNKLDIVKHSSPDNEMKIMVRYIVRDFVKSWYCEISNNEMFIQDVVKLLEDASLQSLERLSRIDKFDVIQDFAKLFHLHLVDIQNAKLTLKQQSKYRKKKDRSREFTKMTTLHEAFDSLGLYHSALESREDELMYLRSITDSLLKVIFPPEVYIVHSAKEMLVDILTCQIMIRLVDLISQPYWLHVVLILLLSDEEPVKEIGEVEVEEHPSVPESSVDTQSPSEMSGQHETHHDADNTAQSTAQNKTNGERLPPIGASAPSESPLAQMVQQDKLTANNDKLLKPILRNTINQLPRSQSAIDLKQQRRDLLGSSRSLASTGNIQGMVEEHIPDSIEAALASSKPERIFTDIYIDSFETAQEAGGQGTYTLYQIHYSAWHPCRETGSWKLTDKQTVKRRYREFVTLHDRLEEIASHRASIKGITGPQRFGIIPGSISEKKADKRKRFLNNYLKDLISVPLLCNSQALREFVAYEGDAQIAYVQRENMPAFGKLFVDSIKLVGGAVSKFTTVLPSLPDKHNVPTKDELQRRKQLLETTALTDWTDPDATSVSYACRMGEENDLPSSLQACLDSNLTSNYSFSDMNESIEACITASESKLGGFLLDSSTSTPEEKEEGRTSRKKEEEDGEEDGEEEDGEEEDGEEEDEFKDAIDDDEATMEMKDCIDEDVVEAKVCWDKDIPLAVTLLDLALQSVADMDTWLHRESVVKVAKTTVATFLEAFLRREVDAVTTKQHCTYYLHLLSTLLWPDGELDRTPTLVPSTALKEATRKQARQCLTDFFPGWLPYAIGHEEFEHSVDAVMASVDDKRINRQFTYKLLDLMMEHVLPELSTSTVQEQLVEDSSKGSVDTNPRLDSVSSM